MFFMNERIQQVENRRINNKRPFTKFHMQEGTNMDFFKKGLALGIGLALTSKEHAEKIVNELVKKGELSLEDSKEVMNQLMERGQEEKNEWQRLIREQLTEWIHKLDLVTKDDLKKLEQRIQNLENKNEQKE